MDIGHVLLQSLAALHADAVLLGVGVCGKGGDGHGGHHAELASNLLLVHAGGLHSLCHAAAALPLQPLEVLLHLLVDGLSGVVKQGLIGLFLAGQLPGRVIAHAVLVDGLELDAVVQVVLVLVVIGHPFFPAEQPPLFFLLFFLFFAPLALRVGGRVLLLGRDLHRAGGKVVQVGGLLRLRGRGLLPGRGRLPDGGLAAALLRQGVGLGLLLGGSGTRRALGGLLLPLGPLFRQNILQGKILVILCHTHPPFTD